MHVVAYLAGVPPSNKNSNKREILTRFIDGVKVIGDKGVVHHGFNIVPADVAVIQGWTHEQGKSAPHLTLRQRVIDEQRQSGKRLLVVDSNLFNYRIKNHPANYLRYSFDGVFPTTGNYFDSIVDPARWRKIERDMDTYLLDWRTQGNYILICTQRLGGWSMKGLDPMTWLNQTVEQIRQYSDRPIRVRAHPGDKQAKHYLTADPRWEISTTSELKDDLYNAWAVVTYNSSPGVAGAIEGIPVFVTDPNPKNSQAFPVANTDLSQIENPKTFDRQEWLHRLAMSHWNFEELSNGNAWRHIRQFVTAN
jgi:hypothetical protein